MTSVTPRSTEGDTAPAQPPTAVLTDTRPPTKAATGPGDLPPPRAGIWEALRPLVHRLHFYAGILVGPFLLVAATTGLLYTTTPTLEPIVHGQELFVDEVGPTTFAMDQQVAAARDAHPEGSVVQVRPPATPDRTTRVVLAVDDVPEGYTRTVFVDPYTLEVQGALPTFGEWLPVRAWFDDLHRNLHLGEAGRWYSELAASWLWVVALGGLAMWVARVARTRKARRLVVPEVRARSVRKRVLSWHGAVGTLAIVGLLGLSVTGLTWSERAGANISDVRAALSWGTPQIDTALPDADPSAEVQGGEHDHSGGAGSAATSDDVLTAGLGINGALAVARGEGLRDPLQITPPDGPGQAWTVSEVKRSWPLQQDSVAIDGRSGAVVDQLDFEGYPLPAKLTTMGISLHMGLLFGIWNQLALAALAVGLITLIVLGYRMWWLRRPTRALGRGPGPLPPRGGLRRAPTWLAVAVIALAAGVGWVLPWFGVPLAVFLLVDLLLAARARRRIAA
ncbi:PepSY-associated TM helix domain-containing protein [Cellulosimicrobium arenosum]|uniref:PepSY domain-containing protein n=1 Tax=Cellulosimicrobium arenosum TaxID=2708133 RepID=A0A927J0I5_9MICO|nr:PepSY domain-containing protein [Cellulosimicrobium arenosum]MBD8079612.1 PepSY domain-containing protein [Cellulosimicrobium arenosum]